MNPLPPIQPTGFPLPPPSEDMPTRDEIEARNAFHAWNLSRGSTSGNNLSESTGGVEDRNGSTEPRST